MNILLVEDDERLGKLIRDYLLSESKVVDLINTGVDIIEKLERNSYDVLILDVLLPKKNGIDICRELRAKNIEIAILFITALNNHKDKIKAFESGADDYLIKPFDFQELLLRVKALIRRGQQTELKELKWNGLVIILEQKQVIYNDKNVHLTPTEFKILQIFLETPNKIFDAESIIDRLWDIDTIPTQNTLRTHIKSLRKKIEEVGLDKNFIETVYGMGYRLKAKKKNYDLNISSVKEKNKINNNKLFQNSSIKSDNKFQFLLEKMWLDNQDNVKKEIVKLKDFLEKNINSEQISLNEAIRIAHNFVGFLGSIGFDKASKIAREIEVILKKNEINLDNRTINNKLRELLRQLTLDLFATEEITDNKESINKVNQQQLITNKINLLVIDEDIKIGNNLILFLEQSQANLTLVYDIEKGIQYLKNNQYDVVILETAWEKKTDDRLEFLLQIIKQRWSDTKIIIYSKNDNLENRLYCSKYPIDLFLSKTNSIEILWQNVVNLSSKNYDNFRSEKNYDILIIDDDTIFTEVLKTKLILNKIPVNIHIISDSETFLEGIKQIKPQLIILDLQMPKLNGLDICRIIKKDPFLYKIPVIFLTGNLEPNIIAKFVEVGADDFISKHKIDLELYPRIMTHLKKFIM